MFKNIFKKKSNEDSLDKNILVTPITLKNYLEENNKGTLDSLKYLNQIKDSSPSTQNTFQYGKLLYDLHIKRSLISIGNTIVNDTVSNEDNLEGLTLIENAENDLYNLSQIGNSNRKHSMFGEALKNAIKHFESIESQFDSDTIRSHAQKFDGSIYTKKIKNFIQKQIEKRSNHDK